jgi:hypothetical protein
VHQLEWLIRWFKVKDIYFDNRIIQGVKARFNLEITARWVEVMWLHLKYMRVNYGLPLLFHDNGLMTFLYL